MDEFLFSLDALKSAGSNWFVKTRLAMDVPQQIRSQMPSHFQPSLIEENIIEYLAGYLLFKQGDLYCALCQSAYKVDKDHADAACLIAIKQYEGCTKGLQYPSRAFVYCVKKMEEHFLDQTKRDLHVQGIRFRICQAIFQCLEHEKLLQCNKCDVRKYAAFLYVNIRLHHKVKRINHDMKWKKIKPPKRSVAKKLVKNAIQVAAKKAKKTAAAKKAAIFRHE